MTDENEMRVVGCPEHRQVALVFNEPLDRVVMDPNGAFRFARELIRAGMYALDLEPPGLEEFLKMGLLGDERAH